MKLYFFFALFLICSISSITINKTHQTKEQIQNIIENYDEKNKTQKDLNNIIDIIEDYKQKLIDMLPNSKKQIESISTKNNNHHFINNLIINELILTSDLLFNEKTELLQELVLIRKSIHKNEIDQKRITYLKKIVNEKNISNSKIAYLIKLEELQQTIISFLKDIFNSKDSETEKTMHNENKYEAELTSSNNRVIKQLNLLKVIFHENNKTINLVLDLFIASMNCYGEYFIHRIHNEENPNEIRFKYYNVDYMFPEQTPNQIFLSDIFQKIYEKNKKKLESYKSNQSIKAKEKHPLLTKIEKNNKIFAEIYSQGLETLNKSIKYPINEIFSSNNESFLQEILQNIFEQLSEEYIKKLCNNLDEDEDWFDFICFTPNLNSTFILNNSQTDFLNELNFKRNLCSLKTENGMLKTKTIQQEKKIQTLEKSNKSKKNDIVIVSGMVLVVFIAWLYKIAKKKQHENNEFIYL